MNLHAVWMCVVLGAAWPVRGQISAPEPTVLTRGLAIAPLGRGGRQPIPTDALVTRIARNEWTSPREGEAMRSATGEERRWTWLEAGSDGWFQSPALQGGYLFIRYESPADQTALLEASGHAMAYVNGEPRCGDPYGTGWVSLPIALKKGANEILFQGARGRVRARIVANATPLALGERDATLPDLIVGERGNVWGAVLVRNGLRQRATNLAISAAVNGGPPRITRLQPVGPLATYKAGFAFDTPKLSGPGECQLQVSLVARSDAGWQPLSSIKLSVRARRPDQVHKRTFVSEIDGSVQYYAVNPCPVVGKSLPALFLTLHGAGVEALGQAEAYGQKLWGNLIAPTNRRPYGFDWEDWGRLDALEVLRDALRRYPTDPHRIYLTGHSMGGHGTWQLGSLYPDRWAAIAPSAGWISFQSYAGGARFESPTPFEQALSLAASASDTLSLKENLSQVGVYVLHGDADDNVPVTEARQMIEALRPFHKALEWHEQPGAGHWWDDSEEPGAACVDWPPMFDFFARHSKPDAASVRRVRFRTPFPGISASCHWVTVERQVRAGEISEVDFRCNPWQRSFEGVTRNVEGLSIDVGHLPAGQPVTVTLDGTRLEGLAWPAQAQRLWFTRSDGQWQVSGTPAPSRKGPERSGLFKLAFQRRVVLVYRTAGTPEENAWAYAKARFDAETFWYRGNGAIAVMPDSDYSPTRASEHNLILYGNESINSVWASFAQDSPIRVGKEQLKLGTRHLAGRDYGVLFVRPRPQSKVAMVGFVGGTGLAGMRSVERLPIFVSGVGYPDYLVVTPDAWRSGSKAVVAAGFFANDWSLPSG